MANEPKNKEEKPVYKDYHMVIVTVKKNPKGFDLTPGYKDESRVKQFILPTEEYGPVVMWLSQSAIKESDLQGFNLKSTLREDLPMLNFLSKYPFIRDFNGIHKEQDMNFTISMTEKTQRNDKGEYVKYYTMSEKQFENMALEGHKDFNHAINELTIMKARKESVTRVEIPEDMPIHDAHDEKDSIGKA